MCKFYDPWGKEFSSKEDFVRFYNRLYFNDCIYKLSGVFQNSRYVEDEMDMLLKNGIKNNRDVVHILAWKIGKIKHGDSTNRKKFIYHSDWEDAEKWEGENKNQEDFDLNELKISRFGREFNVKGLIPFVVENAHEEYKGGNAPQDILNSLAKFAPKGVGTVYLITLLYFMSKGEYPIYDRFANIALKAIYTETDPTKAKKIQPVVLPSKPLQGCKDMEQEPFEHVINEYLVPFKDKINDVFGYDYYQNTRDVDRALWVYGHLFSTNSVRKVKEGNKEIERCNLIQNQNTFFDVHSQTEKRFE